MVRNVAFGRKLEISGLMTRMSFLRIGLTLEGISLWPSSS